MRTLSSHGASFRTNAPLTLEAAERFARCLSANRQYSEVVVVPARRTNLFNVLFKPTSEERAERLRTAAQAEREDRAEAQAGAYDLRPLVGGDYTVVNLLTGEVYTASATRFCTCPDYLHRCKAAGIQCKHMVLIGWHETAEAQALADEIEAQRLETEEAEEWARKGYEEAEREAADHQRLELVEREAQNLSSRADGAPMHFTTTAADSDGEWEARQHARRMAEDFGPRDEWD